MKSQRLRDYLSYFVENILTSGSIRGLNEGYRQICNVTREYVSKLYKQLEPLLTKIAKANYRIDFIKIKIDDLLNI